MSEVALRRTLSDNADDTVHGIALIVLTYFIMTVADTAAKFALPVAGVACTMMARGVIGAAGVAVVAVADGGPRGWRRLIPRRTGLVVLRALLHTVVSSTWYIAWTSMSLVDSYAIGFLSPLLITLLAVPMLGKRLYARKLLATAAGFVGVLVMLRPGGHLWSPAVPLLLFGILVMAISRIMTRQLSTTETPECLSFSILVAHMPMGFVFLSFMPPTGPFGGGVVLALAVLGLCNGTAHTIMARAYALSPVSALAPYEYTTLIWGGVLGFVVFRDVPDWSTLLGAAIVVGAGLYNLDRERARRLARQAAVEPPALAPPAVGWPGS